MRFDRFCRKSVVSAPRRAGGTALRVLGMSLALLPLTGVVTPLADAAGTGDQLVPVSRPVPMPLPLRKAKMLGRVSTDTTFNVALSLPWRNVGDLDALISRQNDRTDSLYKKFLTHQQFVDRFAPTQADYDALKKWAVANGLSVSQTSPSRNLLILSGKRDAIESNFHVQLNQYRLATGRVVYANDSGAKLPQSIAARVSGVVGLTDYSQKKPFLHHRHGFGSVLRPVLGKPAAAAPGTGPLGGLTPADIKSIYGIKPLSDAGLDGSGQTIALYEENGYDPADLVAYAKAFNLPAPTISNITIGGYTGAVTNPDIQGEVTLDIELVMAVAPKANILVYEFDSEAFSATINDLALEVRIADDNLAQVVSESYGIVEADAAFGGQLAAEGNVFKQMAVQGQSMLASSGDSAAYNTIQTATDPAAYAVSVNEPASQPFVTGVGGTSLVTAPISNGVATFGSETTWFDAPLPTPVGGGGGESSYFTKPDYQAGHGASATMRDVPDVSLLAGGPGFSIYQASIGDTTVGSTFGFSIAEGTSAACPLWAAFLVLVNQQRAIYSLPPIGFANPSIYTAAEGANYNADFHDVKDGSTDGVYTATAGFDDATGWGSYVASNLLPEFAPSTFGAEPINVKVVNANGNPVSGAIVAAVTPQIAGYQLTMTSGSDGTATITVPTGVHNFNGTGNDVTLSFIVSADLSGFAGSSQAGIAPPTTSPVILRILAPDHTYTSGTLQMISAPFDYSTVGDFATLFGLTPPVGTTSGSAQLFAYSPTLTAYLKYPTAPADTLRLGQGYWAVLPGSAYVRRKGVPAPTNQAFRINLLPGWNMIGDPFQSAVSISNIQVDTIVPGSPVGIGAATTVQLPFYFYNGAAYQTLGTGDTLQPFQGYWVHASQAAQLVIPVP